MEAAHQEAAARQEDMLLRLSRAARGIATTSQHIERWLRVKRKGGKGGATRRNKTTSQGKQKVNGRWEVEVAHQ